MYRPKKKALNKKRAEEKEKKPMPFGKKGTYWGGVLGLSGKTQTESLKK